MNCTLHWKVGLIATAWCELILVYIQWWYRGRNISTILYYIALHYIILSYSLLYFIILYHIISYYIIFYYIIYIYVCVCVCLYSIIYMCV